VVRKAYLAAQPRLSVAFRGRPAVLPVKLTVQYLGIAVEALRALRPELPIFGMLPSVHRAAAYGGVHTARPAAEAAMRAWGERAGVPLLDLKEVVGEHVLSGAGNPDGMHWGWAGHAAVGQAMSVLLAPVAARGHVG
jgi:hypothetical protein